MKPDPNLTALENAEERMVSLGASRISIADRLDELAAYLFKLSGSILAGDEPSPGPKCNAAANSVVAIARLVDELDRSTRTSADVAGRGAQNRAEVAK